jgi:hypothetical protein
LGYAEFLFATLQFLLKFFQNFFKENCCSHLFDLRDIIQPITEIMTMGIDRIPEQATNQDHQENHNFGELSGKGRGVTVHKNFVNLCTFQTKAPTSFKTFWIYRGECKAQQMYTFSCAALHFS